MTFNEKFYKENLPKLTKSLDIILENQNGLLDFLIRYLLATNSVEQRNNCDSFIHILTKIRFNLESSNELIRLLYDDYRFKTSVNLLYRSMVDDVINICYLLCFINLNDVEQIALNNELHILHKEYLLSAIEASNAQMDFNNYKSELQNLPKDDISNLIQQLKVENSFLLDDNDNSLWKKNSDIRATNHQYFNDLFKDPDNTRKSFISENKKLEILAKRGYKNIYQLKFLFKYYTQYQHYSPKTIELVNSDIEFDIIMYQHTLGEVILTLNRLFDVLLFEDKKILEAEWNVIAPIIFNTFE